ncbi:DUF805 domain-containing protein [Tritonibacter scottomollicae]|uniref:DUF805 domain-containing protein n=1 Tax=Tritonibacter scottomollicae TaxID=483013 RepID=UPI003AA97E64
MDRLLFTFISLGVLGGLAYFYLLPERPSMTYWVYGWLILSGCLVFIRAIELASERIWRKVATPERKKQAQELVTSASDALVSAAEESLEGASNAQQSATKVANHVVLPAAKGLWGDILPVVSYLLAFSGQASRLEYLAAQAVSGIAIIILLTVIWTTGSELTVIFSFILLIAASMAQLAFGFRRTRDIGVNQWWFLLVLVPPVNLAVLVALLVIPTDEFKGKGF